MRYLLSLILVLATCWADDPIFDDVSPQIIKEVPDDYKLPTDVRPTNYIIDLDVYLDTNDDRSFTFVGRSEIDLNILQSTSKIIFHAKNLDFNTIVLTKTTGVVPREVPIVDITKDEQKDFVTLTLANKTTDDMKNLKLHLIYKGKLNDELRGFYRSSYQKDGKQIWLATTHFEPVSARRAFPCWDEPNIKTPFTIHITPPMNYTAISNMPVKKTAGGKTTFHTTPAMSTYLVAFVVSDFKRKEAKNKNFGVWTKAAAIDSADYALQFGQDALTELDTFTGIPYYGQDHGMKKMDQISIPDFVAGAMENWGLVTYRESRLLYTKDKSTTEDKQAIATVIAHEFSHQWFGNLVTCDWWDYIWLNEGFATFFQYFTTDAVYKNNNDDWQLMEQFAIKNLQASAFVIDATTKTRPLNPKISVKTPDQISSLFDDIAYKKGASILRMMQDFLKADVFQNGLKRYLKDHNKKSVNPNNLFNSIENAESKKVKEALPTLVALREVMSNWVDEAGYPVVTATWKTNVSAIELKQERFYLVEPAKKDKTKWYIPITYVTEASPENKISYWMKPDKPASISLNNTYWFLLNKDQTGYYRVNYDTKNWKLLTEYLKTENYQNISAINRAQLIDDALNLARAGLLEYKTALDVTSYLLKETDYIPWYAAVRAFNNLNDLLQGSKNHESYKNYIAGRIDTFAKKSNYTVDDGGHVKKLAKVLALNTACKYGVKECETYANEKLNNWLDENKKAEEKKFPVDLRRGILCAALRNANQDTWTLTVNKYKSSIDEDEKADILAGLGCTTSDDIINVFLGSSLNETNDINIISAMNSICSANSGSFDILMKFINKNIEKIQEADTEDNSMFISFLNKLANRITTVEQYGELSLLLHGTLQIDEMIEKVEFTNAMNNIAWVQSYREQVEKWIEEQDKSENEPDSASSITLTSFLIIIPMLLSRL